MASVARASYTPFPFAAIVAQDEAKLALILSAINPRVGGVLLSGPKGTGKTTIVRAMGELLPALDRATCPYGCDPLGSNLCASCAASRERGEPIKSKKLRGEIVEMPVSAQLDDVVGAVDLRAALERSAIEFRPGLLARANRNVLYVDEINLLSDLAVDALLDAAAQGVVHVKRGQHAIDYPSRFTLVGTMNPEEGELRPQITDRIGLRVFVKSAPSFEERLEIYRRNARFARDARGVADAYDAATKKLRTKLASAMKRIDSILVEPAAEAAAIEATARLGIDSHRTEFVALEAASALAAWEGRDRATPADVARVFPLAARLRRSRLRVEAQSEHLQEDAAIAAALEATLGENAGDDATDRAEHAPRIVVAPELTAKNPLPAKPQRAREGQPVASVPLQPGGRLDIGATLLDRAASSKSGIAAEPKEPLDASSMRRSRRRRVRNSSVPPGASCCARSIPNANARRSFRAGVRVRRSRSMRIPGATSISLPRDSTNSSPAPSVRSRRCPKHSNSRARSPIASAARIPAVRSTSRSSPTDVRTYRSAATRCSRKRSAVTVRANLPNSRTNSVAKSPRSSQAARTSRASTSTSSKRIR